MELAAGTTFAGYEILEVHRRGTSGVVHRAREVGTARPVALSLPASVAGGDEGLPARVLDGARLAAAIAHPHVLEVLAVGEEDGVPYVATRFVDGEDLAALVHREGPLPPGRAAQIVRQAAAGLDAAHAAGVVHGNVTPAGVLVDATGHVVLTDFRVRTADEADGPTGSSWPLAPEQARGEPIDARTDVHGLGHVLRHALTGDATAEGTDLGTGDPAFDAVIGRALAEDPADRFPSAGDLGRAALAAARGERALASVRGRVVATGAAAPRAAEWTTAGPVAPGGLSTDADAPLPTRGEPEAETDAAPRAHPAGAVAGGVGLAGVAQDDARPSRRRGLALLGAGLGIAALTGALVLIDRATRGEDVPAPTRTAATTPAETSGPEVTATVPAGSRPNAIAAGSGRRIYVLSNPDEQMTVLDGATATRVERQPVVGAGAQSVDVGYDRVWVAKAGTGSLLRLSARTGLRAGTSLPLPPGLPVRVRAREGSVWVGLRDGPDGESAVAKFDPAAGTLAQTVPVADGVQDLDVGAGAVWVVTRDRAAVVRIDIASGEQTTIPVGAGPRGIAVGEGAAWVAASQDGAVTRIEADPPHATRQIPVGAQPRGVAVGAGSVWVTNAGDGTVSRIDAGRGEVVGDPIDGVGTEPGAISAGRDAVWVVSTADGSVARIDVPAP